ncbi:type IV secretory system conjugative DNA transfer VirD4/TraG family protein [Isoptericola jiangsuensis]|uniref:Type IV secretory system conjugative DNA transfer VirD4/TraG family protein n=1 Tax=Isoptericola jiangsuensis TaxID=548579 RepID=A0A2A9EYE6_9MICO|nr:TraM recognition domain-containing protein [Isoptericola jiangsuensis]PFG43783.1 type IV secretory system conjugative DNA transfer VirD4/TraG family protein [Isoptericola jiangsuensis]
MTSQRQALRRHARANKLGSAAAVLSGRAEDGVSTGANAEESEQRPAWFERVEQWLRSTRFAWWLRRYGGAYRGLAALNDGEVAQTFSIAWLVYTCVGVIASFVVGPWTVAIIVPLGIVGLAVTLVVLVWWFGYRRSGARLRHQMLAREGLARGREVAEQVGAAVLVATAETVRPTFTTEAHAASRTVNPESVAFLLGHTYGEEVWVSLERPVYVLGPARSGKGVGVVVPAILGAPGACLSTSTRTDNLEATAACRAERGPVEVFNLEASGGRPHTICWSPLEGCEVPRIAMKRAKLLVGASGLGGDNAVWATSAGGIVMALLYAAAISGRTIGDVYRWSKSPDACKEAMQVLERAAHLPEYCSGSGEQVDWHTTIRYVMGEEVRMKANKWFGVENAFVPLMDPHVRERLAVRLTDDAGRRVPGTFDTEAFLREGGTCYLISAGTSTTSETAGTIGTFYSLFLDHVTDVAHESAQRSPGGRLDPPLTLVLDELANIHPWPGAARMSSSGSGEGIQLVAVFQSRSQGKEAYGEDVEETIWNNCLNVLLPNVKAPELLSALAQTLGAEDRHTTSASYSLREPFSRSWQTQSSQQATVEPGEMRRLPKGHALVIESSMRPMLVDLIPYWRGPHADHVAHCQAWYAEHRGMATPPRASDLPGLHFPRSRGR